MITPVPAAGQYGVITDQPHTEMPFNAWTFGRNVRFFDGAAYKFTGHREVFSGALVLPQWLLPVSTPSLNLWLYAGDSGVGATDGSTHAVITRASGPYASDNTIGWTGTVIEGLPVINNGVDVPQVWSPPTLSQLLIDLPNWPVGMTARALRGLKRYLVAFDVTIDGVRSPTMIRWSGQAPTGQVPLTWNDKDETQDAGEWVLPEKGGFLVDAVPLRDDMMLYREREAWLMSYAGTAGGVFRFNRKFGQVGTFVRRCAQEFMSGKHFVFTGDDAIVHDGQNVDSVMTQKAKGLIDGVIDTDNLYKSFVVVNWPVFEVWICAPRKGQTYPDLAVVWNWKLNTWSIRDLPSVAFIENGVVPPPATGDVWDNDTEVWDVDTSLWGDRASTPAVSQMLMASPLFSKFYAAGQTVQFDGADFTATLEREGLMFPTAQGQPPQMSRMRQIIGIWPNITGTLGGIVNVYVGTQNKLDGPITYGTGKPFTIGSSDFLDFTDSDAGRFHSLKFESNTAIQWKLASYEVDVVDRGVYSG